MSGNLDHNAAALGLRADRADTDESLQAERGRTDALLDARVVGQNVDQALRDTEAEAATRLTDIRKEVDAHRRQHNDGLSEISETLENVAHSLHKAAANLTDVADVIKDALPADADAELTDAAATLNDAAERMVQLAPGDPARADHADDAGDAPAAVLEQLAEIAGSMADVSATLADERREADARVQKEREVTDRILEEQRQMAEVAVDEMLADSRRVLAEERHATDVDLADERRHTDQAVEHVLDVLAQEQRARATVETRFSTRNEFLAIVSHDLRTPLMTISGVAELIANLAPPDDAGHRIRSWTDMIDRAAATMDRLICDLLDFTQMEDGRLKVAAKHQDIRDLVRQTVESFLPVATGHSISLEAQVPAEPVMAAYDADRILQVLSNLVQNAIKFTPAGGSIRVRATAAGDECLVAVVDTGIGIMRKDLATIFERFRQLNGGDRAGLGLGLYISKWIVEAHRGRIWAESRPGVGSSFYFTLPRD